MKGINAKIAELSEERHRLWTQGAKDSVRIAHLTSALADLYEQKRIALAAAGAPSDPLEIVRRARIESELEKLMSS